MTIFLKSVEQVKMFVKVSFYLIFLLTIYNVHANNLTEQRVMFSSESSDQEYRLTLGALKKINSINVAEHEVLLRGNISRKTIEFNRNVSLDEAWDMVEKRYFSGEYSELYSCEGLECGSSNAWANDRFEIKQLYGLDQSQRYYAMRSAENANQLLVVYFVQRGNHRIYVQIDSMHIAGSAPNISPSYTAINNAFLREGFYGIDVNAINEKITFNSDELAAVIRALRLKPFVKFYVVGHAYSAKSAVEKEAQALLYATRLKKALIDGGVKEHRLDIKSVGDLAPRELIPHSRVELVVKR